MAIKNKNISRLVIYEIWRILLNPRTLAYINLSKTKFRGFQDGITNAICLLCIVCYTALQQQHTRGRMLGEKMEQLLCLNRSDFEVIWGHFLFWNIVTWVRFGLK